jgi:hypothetical protein
LILAVPNTRFTSLCKGAERLKKRRLDANNESINGLELPMADFGLDVFQFGEKSGWVVVGSQTAVK